MKRSFVLLAALMATQFLYAQDTLSLGRAIDLGLKSNFDVQIEGLNAEIAKQNNTWGVAGALPTINLTINQNNNIVHRKPANPFAVAGRNISDNVNGQLDVQFLLFNGFAVRFNKQRLDQLERLSSGTATFVIETTVQSILLAYYQALLEKERVQVRKKNLTYSKERFEYVKLRKELGGAITFDVLQEQNNYLTDSSNVLLQEIAYRNALRNLNLLLNENLNRTFDLTDSLTYADESYDFETLRMKLTSSNTNLRNQFINQELARVNTRGAMSQRAPIVTLSIGANGSLDQLNAQFRPTSDGVVEKSTVGYLNDDPSQPVIATRFAPEYQTQRGNSYGAYGNIGLRWTLFNGGQVKRAIDNAQIQEKIAQLTTDQLKQSLENDLIAAYDMYNLRRQLVVIARTKLSAAELNLSLANERYRNGSISAIDLRIIQENFLNAALENFLAIYDVLASKADLIRLTGGMIAEPSR
ncbi:MAG: TolC family protein [Bacteroidota bacterium]